MLISPLFHFLLKPVKTTMGVLFVAICAIITLLLFLCSYIFFTQPNIPASASNLDATIIVQEINVLRRTNALPELAINAQLSAAAKAKGEDMAALNYFSHVSPQNIRGVHLLPKYGYNYTKAGENLAVYFDDVQPLINSWKISQTHYRNIIDPDFSETGVAVVKGNFQGVDTFFVVQFFASPKKPDPVQAPTPAIVSTKPVADTPRTQTSSTPPQTQPPVMPQESPVSQTTQSSSTQSETAQNHQPSKSEPLSDQYRVHDLFTLFARLWETVVEIQKNTPIS